MHAAAAAAAATGGAALPLQAYSERARGVRTRPAHTGTRPRGAAAAARGPRVAHWPESDLFMNFLFEKHSHHLLGGPST